MSKSHIFFLSGFVAESNKIEGIFHPEKRLLNEIKAMEIFLKRDVLTVESLIRLVEVLAPKNELRERVHMDIRIGNHTPPKGGPEIRYKLEHILSLAQETNSPYQIHQMYEHLHPFTDGNGRSGRALWAWQMLHDRYYPSSPGLVLGFLHSFYYQTLDSYDKEGGRDD